MKTLLLRITLALTGYAKEKRQLNIIKFRFGQIPSKIELEFWDYRHDGVKTITGNIWYHDAGSHDYFKFKSLDEALAEMKLASHFIGKKVI